MCGIFGYITLNERRLKNDLIIYRLIKRGPDSQDIKVIKFSGERSLILIHTRLSIIDTSDAANQPLTDPENGNWIIFNGEIYNYKELRNELLSEGVGFRSHSDTEVILKGFQKWGTGIFSKLRGMFAVSIFDNKNKELILARDSFGIKPLYYYHEDEEFLFSSNVQSIISSGIKNKFVLNNDAINEYFTYGSFIQPSTILKEVKMLENGCFLVYNTNGIVIKPFEKTNEFVPDYGNIEALRKPFEEVRREVIDSVEKHFVSDVEVGVLLSAGIDSTLIASVSTILLGKKIKTFTIGFIDETLGNIDESHFAEETARYLQTDQRTFSVSYSDFESSFDEFIEAIDVPSYDGFNTFLISKKIDRNVKVVLSGLGGDELFCGYQVFKYYYHYWNRTNLENALKFLPGKILNGLGRHEISLMKKTDFEVISRNRVLNRLSPNDTKQGKIFSMPPDFKLNSVTLFEADNYMKNTLLRDSDSVSMHNSLEIRVPFVDKQLYKTVSKIHDCYKVDQYKNKPLLIEAFKDILPPQIINRPKTGFTLPVPHWFARYMGKNPLDYNSLRGYISSFEIKFIKREHPYTPFMRYILAKWILKNQDQIELADKN